ncbi:MAG TPA: hypothetical protein DCY79_17110 [Planctomycetaceae bacterium]|nr:hypothetical protein [Planctomycetaceae bacterium]
MSPDAFRRLGWHLPHLPEITPWLSTDNDADDTHLARAVNQPYPFAFMASCQHAPVRLPGNGLIYSRISSRAQAGKPLHRAPLQHIATVR